MNRSNHIFLWIVGVVCIATCLILCAVILLPVFGIGIIAWEQTRPFYKNVGTLDANFIPLIEPYRAARVLGDDNVNGWEIGLHVLPDDKEVYYYGNIKNVQKIAVENNIILVYSPDSLSLQDEENLKEKELYWFVIIPSQRIETGFETEAEFLDYISRLGIDQPSWMDLEVAYKQFAKTRCLDWIPNCK